MAQPRLNGKVAVHIDGCLVLLSFVKKENSVVRIKAKISDQLKIFQSVACLVVWIKHYSNKMMEDMEVAREVIIRDVKPSRASPSTSPPLEKHTAEEVSAAVSAAVSAVANTSSAEKPFYECTLCNKRFGYKNGLIRHVRLTHVGEKPYVCNICNRRFGYKHILMEHQNLHFGNRPYACNLCDKKFAARSNLIQHRLVHKKPFHCSVCGKSATKKDMRTKNGDTNTCTSCSKTLKLDMKEEEVMKRHLFNEPQPMLCCNFCKYSTQNATDLNRHLIDLHAPQILDTRDKRRASVEQTIIAEDSCTQIASPSGIPHDIVDGSGGSPVPDHSLPENLSMSIVASPTTTTMLPPVDSMTQHQKSVIIKKERAESRESQGEANCEISTTNGRGIEDRGSGRSPRSHSSSISPISPQPGPGQARQMLSPDQKNMPLPSIDEAFPRRPRHYSPISIPGVPGARFMTPLDIHTGFLTPNSDSVPHTSAITNLLSQGQSLFASHATLFSPTTQAQMREISVQHNSPIPGYPDLEEVISYYVTQGRLFRCVHCDILFYERGMYFLHLSLHGTTSPWECSICHKVCSDKNEFTLHFVNQQHT
ncbi:unnamed protein product [Owenia fusiformis]|uniref:C2H2-type domain-containing protein n=1 Tax=Owenia fusiformis TaxID=6347 RepID=A0A8S4MVJ6_OWEFU|nr:unnamed protein product [Owenia fusiformis]